MNEEGNSVLGVVIVLVIVVGLFAGIFYYVSTSNSSKTSEKSAESDKTNTPTSTDTATATPTKIMEPQETNPVLQGRTLQMETNYGVLNIKMFDKVAPKTTENFIRLSNERYFDGLSFHRIVVAPGFAIIQGGDPLGNGTGGRSIFGTRFEDEIYKKGTTEFVDSSLYANYTGTSAVYRKGYIAMANSGQNTNGSQFFIMLDNTTLAPNYTIFGKIEDADFGVLDKIKGEVQPVSGYDGKPNKILKILSVKLIPIS